MTSNINFPRIVTSLRPVPNLHPPVDPGDRRLAIVGDVPNEDESNYSQPFVGASGNFLTSTLKSLGIDRQRVFLGNICQYRPPANLVSKFASDGPEITEGCAKLQSDLNLFQPNCILLLGPYTLGRARAGVNLQYFRGSIFQTSAPPFGIRKCVATYHPTVVLRDFSGFPLLKFDIKRAWDEAQSPELNLPQREIVIDMSADHLCYLMDTWPTGVRCSLDIEGGLPEHRVTDVVKSTPKGRRHLGWRCVSLSATPAKGFTISWWKFNARDHARVLLSFARLMSRLDVPKVLQNSLYDNFVLSYGYGIPIRNVAEDVMLKGWEVYSELRKGLSTQASIWTREPHWKDEEMYETTGNSLAAGCAKDSAVTLEICNAQDAALTGAAAQHYRFNVEMLNPLLYMQCRGMQYDAAAAVAKRKIVRAELFEVGEALCATAGKELRGPKGSLSAKRLQEALYVTLRYPPQYKKEAGRRTTKLTSDIEAMLSLKRQLPDDKFLSGVLRHRHLEGLSETLSVQADLDNRIRCGYNVVGTETGRLTCYASPTGAGTNLTTITKSCRNLYLADPGHDFFQADLEGADGWTVAAHTLRLGDPTMFEDYCAGMKPAKLIALLYYFGPKINSMSRSDVKWLHDNLFPLVQKDVGKWVYLGSKRVQHGTNYLMGIPTMIWNVVRDSFKDSGVPIYMSSPDARALQNSYLSRYPGVEYWHHWAEATLIGVGKLTSASGHTRVFFGRRFGRDVKQTVKEFLADEPQQNTTYATNCAMLKLWKDPANRVRRVIPQDYKFETCDGQLYYWAGPIERFRSLGPGALVIEPLHQVHDALCGQWPTFLRDWARRKVRSYFDNPLTIANTKLTIPFDGEYGRSWGELTDRL